MWAFSFVCGLKNRAFFNSTLYANSELLKVQSGKHPDTYGHPQLIAAATEGINDAMKKNSVIVMRYGKIQTALLTSGALAYIVWHIYEMYLMRT